MEFGQLIERLITYHFVSSVEVKTMSVASRHMAIHLDNGWVLSASQELEGCPQNLSGSLHGTQASSTYELLVEDPGGNERSDTDISREGGPQKGYVEPAEVIEAARELARLEQFA